MASTFRPQTEPVRAAAPRPEGLERASAGPRWNLLRPDGATLAWWVVQEDRLHLWLLGLLLTTGVLLRAWHLQLPMRGDEIRSFLNYVSKPLAVGLSDYSAANNHPLNTFLGHLAYVTFGDAPWALRLSALVAGCLVIPAAYVLTRLLYGRHAALVAAGLVASSSELIKYSANARGYTWLTLCFLLLLILGHTLLKRSRDAVWVLFAACAAVGFWAVPTMVYAYATAGVWLLLGLRLGDCTIPRRVFLWRLALATMGAALLSVLLYGPIFLGPDSIIATIGELRAPWPLLIRWALHLVRVTLTYWTAGVPTVLAVGFVLLSLDAVVFHRRISSLRASLVLAVALGPVPLALAQRAVGWPRVWLFLLPVWLGLVAAGVAHVAGWLFARTPRAHPPAMAGIALALTAFLGTNVLLEGTVSRSPETGTMVDAPAVVAVLARAIEPGDRVLVPPGFRRPFQYYFQRAGLDPQLLEAGLPASGRLFVVRAEREPVLERRFTARLPAGTWSEARLIASFPQFEPLHLDEQRLITAPRE